MSLRYSTAAAPAHIAIGHELFSKANLSKVSSRRIAAQAWLWRLGAIDQYFADQGDLFALVREHGMH